jgi:pimeloyl-ACP methyl ester carboxylesterase
MATAERTPAPGFTEERFADVGRGITLCYDQIGDPADEPLLLVMGLGTQMIGWPEDFCVLLAERGFHVTRFDNRDIGRSTKLRDVRPPMPWHLALRTKGAAGYLLGDMADDTAGLLDVLGIASTHVVGASMGGMIAQTLAARHPDRVRSLASIMSNTGSRRSGQASPALFKYFMRKPPRDADEAIERTVQVFAAIGSPGFDRDEQELRRVARRSIERSGGGDTAGTGRQLMAVLASGDRTAELRRICVPTVVIHGARDRLVAPSGGRATAKAIPGAKLELIDGMGHDLPRGVWPRIADAVCENIARTR